MNNITTRIHIQHKQGADIAYVYEYPVFLNALNLQPGEYDEEPLKIGSEINLLGKRYIIRDILLSTRKKPVPEEVLEYGFSLILLGEQLSHILTITLIVE